jgi:hypothetical protein
MLMIRAFTDITLSLMYIIHSVFDKLKKQNAIIWLYITALLDELGFRILLTMKIGGNQWNFRFKNINKFNVPDDILKDITL